MSGYEREPVPDEPFWDAVARLRAAGWTVSLGVGLERDKPGDDTSPKREFVSVIAHGKPGGTHFMRMALEGTSPESAARTVANALVYRVLRADGYPLS